jgi:hypothetical protein
MSSSRCIPSLSEAQGNLLHSISLLTLIGLDLTRSVVLNGFATSRLAIPRTYSTSVIPLSLSSKGVLVHPRHKRRQISHFSTTHSILSRIRPSNLARNRRTFATMSEAELLAKSSAWANPGSAALDFRSMCEFIRTEF